MVARIRKLLVANRGEIACRIQRTAHRMGLATVVIHSDADARALHVGGADEAVRIESATASGAYLDSVAIIEAARRAGAQAIHPGYGFLSENAEFAEACEEAGLIFVGPPPGAIRVMADKARAKSIMAKAGVPLVPGYAGDDQSAERLAKEAGGIGYPVLIKAVAGGGGRGMRRVDNARDFADLLESARREAESAFGDPTVLIEKRISEGRHIEIQIFADAHGDCIHLGERDCSTQRRHQKVIEESPSPFVDPAMREAMGVEAVKAAQAVGYVGAGTIEFVVDAQRNFHFLEMNTRLQVEHPVTEMIYGLDLVEWQLRIASGEKLPATQDEVASSGHAIEARLYAEDPYAGFQPQTGRVLFWRPRLRSGQDGIRIDNGIAEGADVTPFYDPMLAKFVGHGRNRAEACERLQRVLQRTPLFGLTTNRDLLIDILKSREFADGAMTIDLLDRWVGEEHPIVAAPLAGREDFAVAASIYALAPGGDWFRSTGIAECPIRLRCGQCECDTIVHFERGRLTGVSVDGERLRVDIDRLDLPDLRFTVDAVSGTALALIDKCDLWLEIAGRTLLFREADELSPAPAGADPLRLVSPVSGLVRDVLVAAGDTVASGHRLVVVEAMKMETAIAASASGVVRTVQVSTGDQTRAGDLLVEFEPPADDDRG